MLVFVSNFYNHHQAFISQEMAFQTNNQFRFIETIPMDSERINMGWGQEEKPDFVLQSYTDKRSYEQCKRLIYEADVVIWGTCPFSLIKSRLKAGKLTFAYSERIFKEGTTGIAFWGRVIKYYFKLHKYQHNHFLLCASGYASADYHRVGLFDKCAIKWGYFPETKEYKNVEELIHKKQPASLLWVARMIDWKHPELAIQVAKQLKADGYQFRLNMIGIGELEDHLNNMIENYGLQDCVRLLGAMKPEQVRKHMEQSQIFLFTSDRNEGWGAVLNEAMNSGCAVVANRNIGSAPFLLNDGVNGLVYDDGDFDALYRKTVTLIENAALRESIEKNALRTITTMWNAKTAIQRFLLLVDKLKQNKNNPFSDGVCSLAEINTDSHT